ncbi:MAG: RluA family pseudouridine synthase [SAR202 cluster bacterium]|nr:RluA family pseudouridine synthase [SAR202 cluster bacterium]
MGEIRHIRANVVGERLDRFLASTQTDLTRAQIYNMILSGLIKIDEHNVKPAYRIKGDEIIVLYISYPTADDLISEEMDLNVIYEDMDLLVIDKPSGIVVHPGPGHKSGTLANGLIARMPTIGEVGERIRPGIIHRLDKDTSGLIVVAKNAISHEHISKQIKNRTVLKMYIAMLSGHPNPSEGIIKSHVGRDPSHRKRMAVVDNGRYAESHFRVLEKLNGYSLASIEIKTGRTHQIRVHMSSIGHPIVGDTIYGGERSTINRQFLHASKIGFKLPSTGVYTEFESKMPEDLLDLLQNIRNNSKIARG